MNPQSLKIVGMTGTLLLAANIGLFSFRVIQAEIFWAVLIAGALLAWAIRRFNSQKIS